MLKIATWKAEEQRNSFRFYQRLFVVTLVFTHCKAQLSFCKCIGTFALVFFLLIDRQSKWANEMIFGGI